MVRQAHHEGQTKRPHPVLVEGWGHRIDPRPGRPGIRAPGLPGRLLRGRGAVV